MDMSRTEKFYNTSILYFMRLCFFPFLMDNAFTVVPKVVSKSTYMMRVFPTRFMVCMCMLFQIDLFTNGV